MLRPALGALGVAPLVLLAACKTSPGQSAPYTPGEALNEKAVAWNGVELRLRTDKQSPALGDPVMVHIELANTGTSTVIVSPLMIHSPAALHVIGPDGKWAPWIDVSRSSFSPGNGILKPGETAALPYAIDLTSLYLIDTPGTYHVRHSGAGTQLKDVNDVFWPRSLLVEGEEKPRVSSEWITIEVGPGEPSPKVQLARRLLTIAPEDWRVAVIKSLEDPPGGIDGELTWKGWRDKIGIRVSLRIGERRPIPNEKLLCHGPWGPVRIQTRNNPGAVWPDYEKRIREALSNE